MIDRKELRRLCEAANPAGKYEDKSEFFVKARIVLPILLDALEEEEAMVSALNGDVTEMGQKLEAAEAEAARLKLAWDSAFNQAMENGQRAANAEARERRLRELLLKASNYVELTYSEEAGEDAAEAKRDLDEINAAIAEAAP